MGKEGKGRPPLPRWGAWTSVLMVASYAGVFRELVFPTLPKKRPRERLHSWGHFVFYLAG